MQSGAVTPRTQERSGTSGHLVHRQSWANVTSSGAGGGSRSTSRCLRLLFWTKSPGLDPNQTP